MSAGSSFRFCILRIRSAGGIRRREQWLPPPAILTVQFAQLGSGGHPSDGVSLKRKAPQEGQRENLRVYETMPPQMLDASGMASFAKMNQEQV